MGPRTDDHGTRAVLAAIAVTALVVVGCTSTTPSPAASKGLLAEDLVDRVVVAETEPPTGTTFSFADAETAIYQPVQGSPPRTQDAIQRGYRAALIRLFFTPGLRRALERGPAAIRRYRPSFDTVGHWSVGSWAAVYEDEASASAALTLIRSELETAWGLEEVAPADLGDEGAIYGGTTPLAEGFPTTIYFWRSGPYLLEVVAHGSVEAGAEELRAIAEGMQERAEA
jgi:hypothetical protein